MNFRNTWNITCGGIDKDVLQFRLQSAHIQMNTYAETLFANERFITTDRICELTIAEITLSDIELPSGAMSSEIFEKASHYGLSLCSMELAAHFRLQYLDQPEGSYLTVASAKLSDDESYPNGFYLRRLEDGLWLRGYRATSDYVWPVDSRFVFIVKK